MAVNEIKIKETSASYVNGKLFYVNPMSVSIQISGKTSSSTYMHGGAIVTKDDYTNNLTTVKYETKISSQADFEYLQKLVGVPASLKLGDDVFSNAVLQTLPEIKLQEYVALEFKAPTKLSL